MDRPATGVTSGRDRGPLSPCVCSTLRMVSRAVTQLYDDILRPSGLRVTQFSILATIARRREANLRQLERALAIDQTTLTRSVNLLERDRMIAGGITKLLDSISASSTDPSLPFAGRAYQSSRNSSLSFCLDRSLVGCNRELAVSSFNHLCAVDSSLIFQVGRNLGNYCCMVFFQPLSRVLLIRDGSCTRRCRCRLRADS